MGKIKTICSTALNKKLVRPFLVITLIIASIVTFIIPLLLYLYALDITENKPKEANKKTSYRWLRRTLRVALGVLIFLLLIVLFVRSPWGQNIIVNQVVDYVSNKTQTKVAIEKLFITFDGDVQLDGLYLEDKQGDTLVYSKSLEANIPLWAMINGGAVGVDGLDWEGLRANITRKDSISGYNFQFLIDAFAPADSTSVATDTTATQPLNIVLGDLKFSNFDIVFDDDVLGINSRFKIGVLNADMETTDLEHMNFEASDIELANSNIKFIQNKVAIDTTSESDVPLPKFSVESIDIKNVVAYYESQPSEIIADLDIADFHTEIPKIDLASNDIDIAIVELRHSKVAIQTEINKKNGSQASPEIAPNQNTSNTTTFEWPEFKVNLADLQLENNSINFRAGNATLTKETFNPEAFSIEGLVLDAKNIFLKDQKAGINIHTLKLNETSAFNLEQLSVNLKVSEQELSIEDLNLKLNNNAITGYAQLNYNGLNQLTTTPENTKVDLNFPSFRLSLKELFKFQPALKENPYLKTLSEKTLSGNVNASGTLASMNIPNLNVKWGASTQISTRATLKYPTDPEKLQFNIPQFVAKTTREDAMKFIDEKEMGITFPKDVKLAGSANGQLDDISAKAKLTTTQGIASIEGTFKNKQTLVYNVDLSIEDYKIDELMNNPQFGSLTLSLKSQGSGTTINTMDASVDATIKKFQLNGYAINDLNINGDLKNGRGHVRSKYKDDNLNMNLDAVVVLDSVAPEATLELDIIGANLQALGLMQRQVKTGMTVYADFKGNATNYDVSAIVDDGVIVYENQTYLLGSLNALAHVTQDTTSVSVRNKMLDLTLRSNSDPQTFSKALQKHVRSYFYRDSIKTDTISKPVNLKLEGKIAQSPLLKEVFLVNVKDLDTVSIAVDFKEKQRKLKANITAPHINYSGNELDSLVFAMDTNKDNFNFNLGFKNIIAGPLDIPRTKITGNQNNNELTVNFLSFHEDSLLMNVNTKITGTSERLVLKVNPDSLILNKREWSIPKDNEMILTSTDLEFNDFKISKGDQSINITDKLPNLTKKHAALEFNNFKISEVFNYLNPKSKLATGQLNGNFILQEPFTETGIVADLSVNDLKVLKTNFGTLSIDAESLGGNNYDFNANLQGGDVNLDLTGEYTSTTNDAKLNLDLNITEFKMKALNNLALGEIKNAEGIFTGQFKVTGSTTAPQYKGSLNFKNATFNIVKLNTPFTLKDETLNVDNEGFSMSNFTVLDANKNALVLSGEIGTESFLNPTFDLDLTAKNFQVLNATPDDNDFLYGKASFDADAKLTGDLQIPKLDAKLTLNSDTDVTYILPATVANIEERDGVVRFVNRENPNAILTQTEEETATIKGFDISTLINIGESATATIIIDEQTGDNFKVSGEGELDLRMAPNGRINLSGTYEISDGHYELTLYNLVNRKFNIAKGSRITWSGDPFDAKLDVRAIYKVETSASSLMSSQISGLDASVRSKYRQVLPFNVYLNINGELMQPKISFQLDMPEEEQGAVGGQVYGRVQQVNQQESELNRQVFSLLVLNRFYPDSGSDGSSGGFATIARDNLNDAVAGQLNAFSDKVLGKSGIEIDFGLDSYTDYQGNSPTERTQLDVAAQKKLFDDRLVVRVGSEVDIQGSSPTGETTPLIGNVSLEYMLSEDGRYRLKGFRKSAFENVIDGQTIISGIALIFTQEFNDFRDLWDAMLKARDEEEDTNQKAEDSKVDQETSETETKEKNTNQEASK